MNEDMQQATTGVAEPASPQDQAPPEGADGSHGPARRRRRRRRGGRGRGRGGRAATTAPDSEGQAAPAEDAGGPPAIAPATEGSPIDESEKPKGGRGRSVRRSGPPAEKAVEASVDTPTEEKSAKAADKPSGRRSGKSAAGGPEAANKRPATRAGKASGKGSGKASEEPVDERPDEPPVGDAAGAEGQDAAASPGRSRRRRRGGRRGRSRARALAEGTAEALDGMAEGVTTDVAASPQARRAVPEAGGAASGKERGRETSTRTRRRRLPSGRRRREPMPVVPREANKTMLITQLGDRDQIAVLQENRLIEHYITRAGARSMVGNVYLGKVQNVLPGMEAAFVDVGRGRNAVLYAGEVSYDEEIDGQAPRIEQVLKVGKNVLVQVTKDPIGGKGARVTQEVSVPGRYLVLVPSSHVFGISRRLPDDERKRLKEALKAVRPSGDGVIVRTAADGAEEDDLRADLDRLTKSWAAIAKSAKRGRAPRVLYEEPELTVRVVRDLFTEGEFKEIITDSERIFDLVTGYLSSVAPELTDKVHRHSGALPVFEEFHVTEQIHKALDRKVWLPSGGYIVIDRTEAMTVVDVNTGRHVGKANLEETVTKTNLEAAEEVARQLRLRDIGGMIIIDFIDMLLEKNKEKVIQTMRNEMAKDKTRSQVFDIGPLGLLEVTRKRVSAGLLESFSETCPMCEGRGILLTNLS